MGKFEKKKNKKKKKSWKGLVIGLVLVIVLSALALFVVPQVLYRLNPDSDMEDFAQNTEAQIAASDEQPSDETAHPTESGIAFPYALEDGKLEVESVFQFDGINPDCGNQAGNEIASITVTNLSDTYLENAKITITAHGGRELHFAVTELPAGKATMAFSQDNAPAEADAVYTNIICEAVFDADASMNADKISVSVDGTHVALQNNTNAEIAELVVYCRSTLGDQYFGGITYTYTVNNLPAHGTAELDATDCILGLAEVVRVDIK